MKVTVGGCRDYAEKEEIFRVLDEALAPFSPKDTVILSGHCSGVDRVAERYAEERGLGLRIVPADWRRYGRGAGPVRNRQMVEESDLVIAFWDGRSKGTASLIAAAEKLGVPLRVERIKG